MEAIGEDLTFEKIRAAMQAVNEQLETVAEHIRALDAQMKEIDRIARERARQLEAMGVETCRSSQETGEWDEYQKKQWDKWIGDDRFGEMPEHMVVPNLAAKFRELGFIFTKTSAGVKIANKKHNIFINAGPVLENSDKVMVVETMIHFEVDDIDDHVGRMEKLRAWADTRHDGRIYLGAVAGVKFEDSVKNCALKNGFYVLEPSGNTFIITEPESQGYALREWQQAAGIVRRPADRARHSLSPGLLPLIKNLVKGLSQN
jgi:hypothetical protein